MMSKKYLSSLLLVFIISQNAFSFDSLKVKMTEKPPFETRNHWGVNFIYTDKGFGIGSNLFKSLSNTLDLVMGVNMTGVKDANEFEQFDIFGNSMTPNKINRVYTIPITIGIQKYLFSNDLDESFRPVINIGISPTLVLTNPYDKGFFKALGYFNAGFAFGGYAGIGMEYKESNRVSFCIGLRYAYLPVLVNEIKSLKDKIINDVGGFQLMIGINFLK